MAGFQLSAGVQFTERDLTNIVPAVSTSAGAFAGAFTWGPVLDPVTISDEIGLVQRFGKPADGNFMSFFSAANFLSYTNNLLLVRADTTGNRNAVSSQIGTVSTLTLTSPGSGYTSVPTVTIDAPQVSGGIQATAIAALTGGAVTSLPVTAGGIGYTFANISVSAPQVAGGVTATGTAVISGSLTLIPVTAGGTGYSANPVVTIAAPTGVNGVGVQATATATVVGGIISSIVITNAGTGYIVAPTVTITDTTGINATAGVPTLALNKLDSIRIVNAGSGYTTVPTVTVNGSGSGATATALIANSGIKSVTIVSPGNGYTTVPNVTFTGGGIGSGAAVTAAITVGGVKINNLNDYQTFYANGQGIVGEFTAKYPGDLGNSLLVSMADSASFASWAYKGFFDSAPGTSDYTNNLAGSNDEIHVIVIDTNGKWSGTPGTVLERFAFVSKASDAVKSDGTNNYYVSVLNTRSKYVWWTAHPTAGTNWGAQAANTTFVSFALAVTRILSGGVTDLAITDGQQQTAYSIFANDELYDISLLFAGKASSTVANYIISNVAEVRRDILAFISPQNISSGGVIIGTGSDAVNQITDYRNLLPSSSYATLDTGYKYQYDRYNDKYRYIPLNGDIAGLAARTDYTTDPWFSPAGLNRGQIKNVVKLAVQPDKTSRDNLYKNGINPVVTLRGQGTVLYGDKTLLAKPSAFQYINVRRLFIVLEKAIASAAKYQLFEFNDDFTRAQFRNLTEPFLRDVQGRRGITAFLVKCDGTNNTGEVIDRAEFVADIYVKPSRSINFVSLNFIATRSGISFSEVGA